MGITKQGNLLLSVPLHIGQNQLMKKMIANKTFHKGLWENFYNGATGGNILSRDAAKYIGYRTPIVPEVGILADEAYKAGQGVSKYFTKKEPDLRTLARLRNIAKGKYTKFVKRPLREEEIGLAKAIYGKYMPNNDINEFEKVLRALTPEKALELEKLFENNPITKNLVSGVIDRSTMPSPKLLNPNTVTKSTAFKKYQLPSEIAVNGALLALDTGTFMANAAKRALYSDTLRNKSKLVAKVQDFGNDFLTNNPIKKALATGGVKKKNFLERFYDRVINPEVINPINAYAIDLAEGIGKIKNTK